MNKKNFTILIIIITNDKQQLFLYYNFLQIAKLLPLRKVPFWKKTFLFVKKITFVEK